MEFARTKWDNAERAYRFLQSTMTADGLAQNQNIGHGWIEGGPLLPVKTELYQSGLGAEALRALSNLAHLTGKEDVSKNLAQEFAAHQALLNQAFWSPGKKLFSFALDRDNKQVEIPSVLSTVPMWFGLLDPAKSQSMLTLLADSDQEADWGMRIISDRDPKYDPGGYHFGSVWPLFTGWASVGEYRSPHVPYDWTSLDVKNVHVGTCVLDLSYHRTAEEIVLDIKRSGGETCTVEFSPAISLRATASAELNGHALPVHADKNSVDQHGTVHLPVLSGTNTLRMRVRNDFGLSIVSQLPALGDRSQGLRVVSESWSNGLNDLTMELAGRPGHTYELSVWNPEDVRGVDGATLKKTARSQGALTVTFPSGTADDFIHTNITFHFAGR